MTATTTTARIDPQTQEELMRQAGIWIEHSTLIEDDLPARPLAAVQAEKHQLDRYTQLVAARAAGRAPQCLAQIEEPARTVQSTAPERIYLQGGPQLPPETEFGALSEVTWCRDDVDGTGIPYVRADLAGAAPAAVGGPAPDVTLDEDQAGLLRDMLGDPAEYPEAITVRLLVGDGHSGHGLYVAQAEYQDEGAALLTSLPAPAAPALEAPAAPSLRAALQRLEDTCQLRAERTTPEAIKVVAACIGMMDALEEMDEARKQARAALAAAPQAPAKGLPYEPTSDMLNAGRACDPALPIDTVRAIWWAMWRTAPQAPAAPSGLPSGWVPCILTHDGQHPEEVAYGQQIMMDRLKKWLGRYFELLAQAAPAAPAVDAWLQPADMAALQRFHETAEDDESYDIGKDAVARLCAFGCLQSHSFGRYSTTDFGDYLLGTWAGARTLPFTTAAERRDRAAQAKEGGV